MNRVLLRMHLGLGDALIVNGLVRVLVERGLQLTLPSKPHNEPSVRAMFADLGDAVEVLPVLDDNYVNPCSDEIRLGYFGENFDPKRFDESFYRQAGVPFLAKWEKFKIGQDVDMYNEHRIKGDVFVHDDDTRGFAIPLQGHRPRTSASVFDHFTALYDAKEIHCINSSFAILADLIRAPGKKFLHHYARPTDLPIYGEHWVVIRDEADILNENQISELPA